MSPEKVKIAVRPLESGEPRQVGRYRLLAALGEGGMGRVFLGVGPDARLVAVKQVHPGFAHDADFRSRFRREVEVSRRVSGAYTAPVLDADPDAETPWLASVYVAGPSLREAVDATGPLPVRTVRFLAAGLVSALTEIHRVGLVHRDLKPGNVLLADDGPRVIDFGIARAAEGGTELTHTGSVVGSPSFMSPEQAESRALTPASDVFALGALLVMACTGRAPFGGQSAPVTLYQVVHFQPDLTGVPPGLLPLIEACLAKDPAHRPTPAQILDYLGSVAPAATPWPAGIHRLIDEQREELEPYLEGKAVAPDPHGRTKAIVFGGALIAAVVAVGVTVAVSAGSDGGASGPPPPDRLAMSELRRVDPCQVLTGDLPGLGVLTPEPGSEFDGCGYSAPSGGKLTVDLGAKVDSNRSDEPAAQLNGLPLLVNKKDSGKSCDATVTLPGQQAVGISVSARLPSGDGCPAAKAALSSALTRITSGAPAYPEAGGSLIFVDPCAAVDRQAADRVLGAVSDIRPADLHSCAWRGSGTLTVAFTSGKPSSTGEPVPLADGVVARQEKKVQSNGDATCTLDWGHRQRGEQWEKVQVQYKNSAGQPPVEELCRRVKDLAGAVRLPR